MWLLIHALDNCFWHQRLHVYIYSQLRLYRSQTYQDITHNAVLTGTEHKSDFNSTTYTPYLALTGKLWGVTCEYFGVNGPCYNGTTLYIFRGLSSIFLIDPTPYFPLLVISWLPSLGSWSTFTGLPGWPATYSDVTRPGLIHSDGSNISFMKSLGNYT